MSSDIVDRLRAWVYTAPLYETAVEAAREIERLRSRVELLQITDVERTALEDAAAAMEYDDDGPTMYTKIGDTFRKLLARIGEVPDER